MQFATWGLTGTLTTERPADASFATACLWRVIDEIDAACNRFRADSELSRLNASAGETVTASTTLLEALDAAVAAFAATDGLCDPTVLAALLAWGYDRDYDLIRERIDLVEPLVEGAPGIAALDVDRHARTVRLAPGCQLDLGASAKALAPDLVADEVGARGGVVVEIGGDVAVRGTGPDGPWVIGVADRLTITGDEPRVRVNGGGVATSSIATRVWHVGGRLVNHIIDPRTGLVADGPYATATVAADRCVTANAFATAALLWGEDASYRIAQAGWSARLVRRDGTVEFVGGWPVEEESS